MANKFQFKRGTAAAWTAANPVLADGEFGLEKVTGQFKIGDGVTAWNALPYGGLVGPAGANGTSGVDGFLIAGGQNFTANKTIGSNDNYSLTVKTNSTDLLFLDKTQTVTIGRTANDFNYPPKVFGSFIYQTTADSRAMNSTDSSFAYYGSTSESKDGLKNALALRAGDSSFIYSGEYNVNNSVGTVSLDGIYTTFNAIKAVIQSTAAAAIITYATANQSYVINSAGVIRNATGFEVASVVAGGTDAADHVAAGLKIGTVTASGSSTNNTSYGVYIANTITATGTNPNAYAIKSDSTAPSIFAGSIAASNYLANMATNASAPNATIPVVSFTPSNSSTDVDLAFVPKGTGAFTLAIADGTTTGGNKRGTWAIDLQTQRNAADQVASASGSFAAGMRNKASGTNSIALGISTVASASASIAIGNGAQSSGASSISLGLTTIASGGASMSTGDNANTFSVYGRRAHCSGVTTLSGDAQTSTLVLRNTTSDATATTVVSGSSVAAASTTNQLLLQNNNAMYVIGRIIGKKTGSTESASYDFKAHIVRGVGAGTIAIVTQSVTAFSNVPAWGTPTLTADTTNGVLQIKVVGLAGANIRWSCVVDTCEVIYA